MHDKQIIFKLRVLTYRSKRGTAPQYLSALLRSHQPSRTLRSASQALLTVNRTRLDTKVVHSKSRWLVRPCRVNCHLLSSVLKHYHHSSHNGKYISSAKFLMLNFKIWRLRNHRENNCTRKFVAQGTAPGHFATWRVSPPRRFAPIFKTFRPRRRDDFSQFKTIRPPVRRFAPTEDVSPPMWDVSLPIWVLSPPIETFRPPGKTFRTLEKTFHPRSYRTFRTPEKTFRPLPKLSLHSPYIYF